LASFVTDEPYLLAAVRYVELNPVRADLWPGKSGLPPGRWIGARTLQLPHATHFVPQLSQTGCHVP